jgi:hypothetical protein
MNKYWSYLGTIGSLAILITACGDSKPAATPSPSTSPSAVASPAAAVPATTPATPVAATTPTPAAAKTTPTVLGTKPVSVDVAAGLIPPTNGENWAKTVAKGRTDPFASLSLQPIEVAKIDPITGISETKIATNSNLPAIKSGVNKSLPNIKVAPVAGNSKIASKGSTTAEPSITRDPAISSLPRSGVNKTLPKIIAGTQATKPSKSAVIAKVATKNVLRSGSGSPTIAKVVNNVLRPVNIQSTTSKTTGATAIAAKPEKVVEKPLQAMAVEISGIIELEGKTQVIVKLPNESFSRYVDVGDRVADGRVLIKRVESQQSLSPTVVLEEVGVEVLRKVGEKSAANNPDPKSKPQ